MEQLLNKFNLKMDTSSTKSNRGISKRRRSRSVSSVSRNITHSQSNEEIGKDLETLRLQNYDRCNFNYNVLSKIGWWPDEILKFAEINRISYIGFIQIYHNKSNMFDTPIRNAIYFMLQAPYCNDDTIKKFISHRTTDISDNYWSKVVDEDNCYMDGLENRDKSKNKYQHYYLLHALIKLLSYDNIGVDKLSLKEKYIKKIKIFIAIYNLKNIHAIIDDIIRNILQVCIKGSSIDLYLPALLYDMYYDLDRSVLIYSRHTKDSDLVNRSYLYRDILLYGIYKTVQFSFVYNNYDDFVSYNKLSNFDIKYVHPFSHIKYKSMFGEDDIKRIEYVYLTLNNKIICKKKKDKLILENLDFSKLLEQNKNHDITPKIATPKYRMKERGLVSNFRPQFPIFFISDEENKITKEKNRVRHHVSRSKSNSMTS